MLSISSSLLRGAMVVEVVLVGSAYFKYGSPMGSLHNGLGLPIINPLLIPLKII